MRFDGTRAYFDLHAPPNNGVVRGAWSRYMLHGKVTVTMAANAAPGMVSSFITFSDVGDEIDYEFTGNAPNTAWTNVYYRGIPETSVHSTTATVKTIANLHTYTIDWTSTYIKWYVDNVLIRTVTVGSEDAKSTHLAALLPKGQHWFPNTPSLVLFSIWEGTWAGTANWNTAAVQTASFASMSIQCYDNTDKAVAEWPVGSAAFKYGNGGLSSSSVASPVSSSSSVKASTSSTAKALTTSTSSSVKVSTSSTAKVSTTSSTSSVKISTSSTAKVSTTSSTSSVKVSTSSTAAKVSTTSSASSVKVSTSSTTATAKASTISSTSSVKVSTSTVPAVPTPGTPCGTAHTIIAGETCQSIAAAAGISNAVFSALNPNIDANCYYIVPGQTVCIGAAVGTATVAISTPLSGPVTTSVVQTASSTRVPSPTIQTSASAAAALPTPGTPCGAVVTIAAGDSCTGIAAAAGISDAYFRALNPGIDTNCYYIVPGQTVCIAVAVGTVTVAVSTPLSGPITTSAVQAASSASPDPTTSSAAAALPTPGTPCGEVATVAAGDSFPGQTVCIAAADGIALLPVSVSTPLSGPITTSAVQAASSTSPDPTTSSAAAALPTPGTPCGEVATVAAGDSCTGIAAAAGISDAYFRALNPGIDPNCYYIVPGQTVCIAAADGIALLPVSVSTPLSGPVTTPIAAPFDATLTRRSTSYAVAGCAEVYTLLATDTCLSVAEYFGLTIAQFFAINKLDWACQNAQPGVQVCVAGPGQAIKVPLPVTKSTATPTSTAKVTSTASATPTTPVTIPGCDTHFQVGYGTTCQSIAKLLDATFEEFLGINPHLTKDCGTLAVGTVCCLKGKSYAYGGGKQTSFSFGKASNPVKKVVPSYYGKSYGYGSGGKHNFGSSYGGRFRRDSDEDGPVEHLPYQEKIADYVPDKVAPKPTCDVDVAREGDTCATIAARNNLSEAQVQAWNPNGCEPDVGDQICISEVFMKRRRRDVDEL
ncbi:hypothetical protein HKX48_003763 [Thoreauomyces humboldtii]|nr:hypothetical protein HKX48_003763 [Thoreauomyces humboldtii]